MAEEVEFSIDSVKDEDSVKDKDSAKDGDSVKDKDSVKDEDSEVEIHDSDEISSFNYDLKMKAWHCKRLELLCEQLKIDNRESALERQQRRKINANEHQQRLTIDMGEHQRRRKIGFWVAWIAGTVPLAALGTLFYLMWRHRAYFFLMDAVPQAVLISASFLSMVVIYSFLIKGMFPSVIQKNDTNDTHPVADEAIKVARSAIAGKE